MSKQFDVNGITIKIFVSNVEAIIPTPKAAKFAVAMLAAGITFECHPLTNMAWFRFSKESLTAVEDLIAGI